MWLQDQLTDLWADTMLIVRADKSQNCIVMKFDTGVTNLKNLWDVFLPSSNMLQHRESNDQKMFRSSWDEKYAMVHTANSVIFKLYSILNNT